MPSWVSRRADMIGVDAVVGGFPVHALVKAIDDDQGGYFGFYQRSDDDLCNLGTKKFPPDIGAEFQDLEQPSSELWV